MSEAKPVASLTAGLLAQKGFARPAMRPQLYGAQADTEADEQRWPTVITLRPQAASSPARPQPVRARTAPASKDKAAFTLRLDRERHLKLRLSSAHSRRSAQSLVTEALDRFLAEIDGGEAGNN